MALILIPTALILILALMLWFSAHPEGNSNAVSGGGARRLKMTRCGRLLCAVPLRWPPGWLPRCGATQRRAGRAGGRGVRPCLRGGRSPRSSRRGHAPNRRPSCAPRRSRSGDRVFAVRLLLLLDMPKLLSIGAAQQRAATTQTPRRPKGAGGERSEPVRLGPPCMLRSNDKSSAKWRPAKDYFLCGYQSSNHISQAY